MEQVNGCGYTGYEFGASYPDSTCIEGYLWDLDSGGSDDNGGVYLDSGGDMPCPKCNLAKYVRSMADYYENEGFLSVEHPLTTKMVKNALSQFNSRARRAAKRHWRAGRKAAIQEAMREG